MLVAVQPGPFGVAVAVVVVVAAVAPEQSSFALERRIHNLAYCLNYA